MTTADLSHGTFWQPATEIASFLFAFALCCFMGSCSACAAYFVLTANSVMQEAKGKYDHGSPTRHCHDLVCSSLILDRQEK